jgi:hypothetical protein
MKECNYCGTIDHSGPCPSKTIPNPYSKFPQNVPAPEQDKQTM